MQISIFLSSYSSYWGTIWIVCLSLTIHKAHSLIFSWLGRPLTHTGGEHMRSFKICWRDYRKLWIGLDMGPLNRDSEHDLQDVRQLLPLNLLIKQVWLRPISSVCHCWLRASQPSSCFKCLRGQSIGWGRPWSTLGYTVCFSPFTRCCFCLLSFYFCLFVCFMSNE